MTPLLINVENKDIDRYLRSLSINARKHYKKAINRNKDITYHRIDFDPELVEYFMRLWEEQIVWGGKIKWPIKVTYLEYLAKKNRLLCFCAKTIDTDDIICLQFVEYYGDYIVCGAPLYDKNQYSKRTIAKYMWFMLIKYSINHPKIKWVDFGAWGTYTWRDLVFRCKEDDFKSYKWQFVPTAIKENPQLAEPVVVRANIFNCKKYIEKKKHKYFEAFYLVKWKIARFIYAHKGQRVKQIHQVLSRLVRFDSFQSLNIIVPLTFGLNA